MTDTDVQSWEYLEKLRGTEFYRLYKNPSSALAIFRKRLSSLGRSSRDLFWLPSDVKLAKSLVMGMLYLNAPLPARDLDVWIKPGSRRFAGKEQLLGYSLILGSVRRSTPLTCYKDTTSPPSVPPKLIHLRRTSPDRYDRL